MDVVEEQTSSEEQAMTEAETISIDEQEFDEEEIVPKNVLPEAFTESIESREESLIDDAINFTQTDADEVRNLDEIVDADGVVAAQEIRSEEKTEEGNDSSGLGTLVLISLGLSIVSWIVTAVLTLSLTFSSPLLLAFFILAIAFYVISAALCVIRAIRISRKAKKAVDAGKTESDGLAQKKKRAIIFSVLFLSPVVVLLGIMIAVLIALS